MRNTPRPSRLLDRLLGLVGFGLGYGEEETAPSSPAHRSGAWHYENGRVVREGSDAEALAEEVRKLVETTTRLSQELAELSQDMAAFKRGRH